MAASIMERSTQKTKKGTGKEFMYTPKEICILETGTITL